MQNNYLLLLLVIIFVLGLYFYLKSYTTIENMTNNNCPNMLIEKDGKIMLFNSELPIKKDSNPIEFDNLDKYIEFVETEKSMNKNCKTLSLQYTTDTQNNDLIQVLPSLFENNGGLPFISSNSVNKENSAYFEENKMLDATIDSTPDNHIDFNTNMYSGFDQYNQNIGLDTPLDKIFYESSEISRNPYDPHWGGKNYTQYAVDNGEYEDRYVYKYNTQ